MSITITITDPTPEQIAALFGAAKTQPAKAEPAGKAKAEPKKVDPAPAEETVEEEPETETEAFPTLDEVKAAGQALVEANGREAFAELLAEFKAKNLSAVAESDRAALIAKCKSKIG